MATDPTIINALTATLTFDYGVQIDPNIVSKIPFDSPMFDYLEAQPGAPFKSLSRAATFALLTGQTSRLVVTDRLVVEVTLRGSAPHARSRR